MKKKQIDSKKSDGSFLEETHKVNVGSKHLQKPKTNLPR